MPSTTSPPRPRACSTSSSPRRPPQRSRGRGREASGPLGRAVRPRCVDRFRERSVRSCGAGAAPRKDRLGSCHAIEGARRRRRGRFRGRRRSTTRRRARTAGRPRRERVRRPASAAGRDERPAAHPLARRPAARRPRLRRRGVRERLHLHRAAGSAHALRRRSRHARPRAEGERPPPCGRSDVPLGRGVVRRPRDRRRPVRRPRRRSRRPRSPSRTAAERRSSRALHDAMYPTMPAAALEAVGETDVVGTASELAAAIVALTRRPPPGPTLAVVAGHADAEDEFLEVDRSSSEQPREGKPSGYTCPECHGALWETQDGRVTSLPLPHGPRVLARVARHRAARARRARAVGGAARARGEGGDAAADVAARQGPRPPALGRAARPRRRTRSSVRPSRVRGILRGARAGRRRARRERGGGVVTDGSQEPRRLRRAADVRQGRSAASTSPATSGRASRAGSRSGCRRASVDGLRRVPRRCSRRIRTSSSSSSTRSSSTSRRSSATSSRGTTCATRSSRGSLERARRRADPRLVDGLRDRRGGVLARDRLRGGARRGGLQAPRQDLRDRRRRRRAELRAPRDVSRRSRSSPCPRSCARSTSIASDQRVLRSAATSGGPSSSGGTTSSRIRRSRGSTCSSSRNTLMYFTPEVAGAGARELPLRAARGRLPLPRQVRGADARRRTCSSRST